MKFKLPAVSPFFWSGALIVAFALLAAGCEPGSFSEGDGTQTPISMAELNGIEVQSDSEPAETEAESAVPEHEAEVPSPPMPPSPVIPAPPVSGNNPRYSPGEVEIPAEFLKHGKILELRYERCSLANGLMKQKTSTVYSIAPPSHPIWRQTDADGSVGIGTRARFADGAIYDGFVRDFNGSYPMPIRSASPWGSAFWARKQ